MKNLHLLPTDKPSRLYESLLTNKLFILENSFMDVSECNREYQNIYITSDEYIGLSYYLDGNLIRKGVIDDENYWEVRKEYKKIILTTDQDLINDGVQTINDEFLEWFVQNPSCEKVEVKYNYVCSNCNEDKNNPKYENCHGNYRTHKIFKIIIPKEESMSYEDFRKNASNDLIIKFDTDCSKYSEDGDSDTYFYANCKYWENQLKEEPKQTIEEYEQQGLEKSMFELEQELDIPSHLRYHNSNPKQETFEEAAERIFTPSYTNYKVRRQGFKEGAKWQQDQIPSIIEQYLETAFISEEKGYMNPVKWFEQFKKQ